MPLSMGHMKQPAKRRRRPNDSIVTGADCLRNENSRGTLRPPAVRLI